VQVSLASLECEEAGTSTLRLNRVDFQNVKGLDAEFCLTDVELVE